MATELTEGYVLVDDDAQSWELVTPDTPGLDTGAGVEVLDNGLWFQCSVLRVDRKLGWAFVHFEGWHEQYDSWVALGDGKVRREVTPIHINAVAVGPTSRTTLVPPSYPVGAAAAATAATIAADGEDSLRDGFLQMVEEDAVSWLCWLCSFFLKLDRPLRRYAHLRVCPV